MKLNSLSHDSRPKILTYNVSFAEVIQVVVDSPILEDMVNYFVVNSIMT